MTDRRAASEGPSTRAHSILDDSAHSASKRWVDSEKRGSKKTKGGRNILRKTPGAESPHSSSSSPKPPASDAEAGASEKETTGFFPKLGRMLDGRENKARLRSSWPVEDAALSRRSIRHKHGSLQRQAERSLSNFTNPSLLSVLSSATHQSTASSGSNSTITQKSYNKLHHIAKRRPARERKRLPAMEVFDNRAAMETELEAPNVFQYMNDDDQFLRSTSYHDAPPSSSLSDPEQGQGGSSDAAEPTTNSSTASPASARLPSPAPVAANEAISTGLESAEPHISDRVRSDSGICLRDRSPKPLTHMTSGHPGDEREEEEDEESEESDSSEEEEDDDEHETENTHHQGNYQGNPAYQHQQVALHRAAPAGPPRLPSASSSRHSDTHTRRLRDREQDLRDHVLQPKPQRDFRFDVSSPVTSPYPAPAMPLYDAPDASGAPMHYQGHPAAWPPPAAPIGYYSPTYAPPAPYSQGPESSYAMTAPVPMAVAAPSSTDQAPPFYPHSQSQLYQPQPAGPDLTQTTVVGYELLAGKLSHQLPTPGHGAPPGEGPVVPMYRKFEQLNHRVLLHLQDEISELEEELRNIDECIAQYSPRNESGQIQPASRRVEARYGGDLQYRRTELLGRVFIKLGQYNQALSSFSSVTKDLDAASADDIQAYRTWLEKHAPIDSTEARFLERKDDLLSLPRRASLSRSVNHGSPQSLHRAVVYLPLIAVSPLMVYGLVPSFFGRLFLLLLIGSYEVRVVTSSELMGWMSAREWFIAASIYFGFLAFLAGVVR